MDDALAALLEATAGNETAGHLTKVQGLPAAAEKRSPQMPVRANCVQIEAEFLAMGIDDLTVYPSVRLCFGVAYGLLFLFGLFSNGSVLWAFARNGRLRSSRNFFLLNLILTDVLLCFTAIPVTPWYAMTKNWTFGPAMCRLVPLCNSCAVFVTSWSLTAIAFDKHMHIVVSPTRRHFSRQLAGFVTFSIWVMSFVVNIPYLMSFDLVDGFYIVSHDMVTPFCNKFCDEFNWASEVQRRFYGAIVLLFQFVVPMSVITFCHLCILRKVQKDMIVQNAQFRKTLTDSQRLDAISRKKRVNYTLLGMVVAFIGCNVPLTAVNLAKDFGREPQFLLDQPYLSPLIAHLIAMSMVCWNPLLFFWLSAKDKSRGGSGNAGIVSDQHHNNNNNSLAVVVSIVRRLSRGCDLSMAANARREAVAPIEAVLGRKRCRHLLEMEHTRSLLGPSGSVKHSALSLPGTVAEELAKEEGPHAAFLDRNGNEERCHLLLGISNRHACITKTQSISSNMF